MNSNGIGIDPGLTGAVAALHDGVVISPIEDIPTETSVFGRGKAVASRELAELLEYYIGIYQGQAPTIYLEIQQPMPKQGVSSTFCTGDTFGVVRACCELTYCPLVMVRPNQWKKAAGLLRKDKEASRTLVRKRWPETQAYLARKSDHNRAEAVLIAAYGGA